VQSQDFQGESPMSGLYWVYLAIALLKALFCELGLSLGWKPKIFDRATTMLVSFFLFGGAAFGKSIIWSRCCLRWWLECCCCDFLHQRSKNYVKRMKTIDRTGGRLHYDPPQACCLIGYHVHDMADLETS
jgi:hypothetical protein